MIDDAKLALFMLLGQTASKSVESQPEIAASNSLMLSNKFDLATALPESVRSANAAAEAYRLFFVFENYLREFIVEVLTKSGKEEWWNKVPQDVKDEITKLEDTEEMKVWMALGSRDKSALMTYPQLLRVMEHCWKPDFEDLLRDRALIQETRHITHLRNTVCHMSAITPEGLERIRQVMRDWFRVVSP